MSGSTRVKMNALRFSFVMALLTSFWACHNLEQEPDADAARPIGVSTTPFDAKQHVDAWVAMWNSYDLNRVDELFLTDDTVTYFSSEKEGLIRGIDAVREHHRSFGFVEGGKPAEKELWVEGPRSTIYGSTVVVTGIWYFGNRSDDRDRVQRGPMTFVYVREGNVYRLAHLHFARYEEASQ